MPRTRETPRREAERGEHRHPRRRHCERPGEQHHHREEEEREQPPHHLVRHRQPVEPHADHHVRMQRPPQLLCRHAAEHEQPHRLEPARRRAETRPREREQEQEIPVKIRPPRHCRRRKPHRREKRHRLKQPVPQRLSRRIRLREEKMRADEQPRSRRDHERRPQLRVAHEQAQAAPRDRLPIEEEIPARHEHHQTARHLERRAVVRLERRRQTAPRRRDREHREQQRLKRREPQEREHREKERRQAAVDEKPTPEREMHAPPDRTERDALPSRQRDAEAAAHLRQHRHEHHDERQPAEPAHQPMPEQERRRQRLRRGETGKPRRRERRHTLEKRRERREPPRKQKRQRTDRREIQPREHRETSALPEPQWPPMRAPQPVKHCPRAKRHEQRHAEQHEPLALRRDGLALPRKRQHAPPPGAHRQRIPRRKRERRQKRSRKCQGQTAHQIPENLIPLPHKPTSQSSPLRPSHRNNRLTLISAVRIRSFAHIVPIQTMRLSYPLGLQPHQGISAASRQTPLPPSLRSAPSPEEKVNKTASSNLPPRTTFHLEHPRVLPLYLPRRQRGGWCRAANATRNLFGGSTK